MALVRIVLTVRLRHMPTPSIPKRVLRLCVALQLQNFGLPQPNEATSLKFPS